MDIDHPNHVCRLHKAIYGLKQARRAWYNELKQFLLTSGFLNSTTDTSLFILRRNAITIYLPMYVVEIIIIGSIGYATLHHLALYSVFSQGPRSPNLFPWC